MTTNSEDFQTALGFQQAGQLAVAEQIYRQILQSDPRHAPTLCMLGVVATRSGRFSQASDFLRQALEIDPADAMAHFYLGNAESAQQNWAAAVDCYRTAIWINPDWAAAHARLGVALQALGRADEAISQYRRALELDPNQAQPQYNWAVALGEQGHADEAAEHYRQALAIDPNHRGAHVNLGAYYQVRGESDQALRHYDRVLEIQSDAVDVHFNRALILLAQGNFAAGWQEYQWRVRIAGFPVQSFREPTWNGSPLGNKTLLIHAEQGLGDTLQFIRYLPLIKERAARLVVQVQSPLVPLLTQSGFTVVGRDDPLPPFDYQIPLLDLPGLLGTTLANLPATIPYLSASPEAIARWRERLSRLAGLKVGIVWQGSRAQHNDSLRSIPLACFEPLSRIEGVTLISLQKNEGTEQLAEIGFPVHQAEPGWDEAAGAFVDSAAIMRNLDLVIAADTAPAHLSGALGVPTWLPLSTRPDWRWLVGRDDSPWYPTMRLFRQTRAGDWHGVFERITADLVRLRATRER